MLNLIAGIVCAGCGAFMIYVSNPIWATVAFFLAFWNILIWEHNR